VKKLAFNLFFLAAISGSALAQDPKTDSLSTFNLDEVVVTGQYEPQSMERSVFKVRTIPMERIKARGAVRLQDVLNTELNIRFEQDNALGTSNMNIQGLGGQNIKLLIDGIPQVGRQSTDNSFNVNQVNVNSIERIEIIEGPMSVIYGADALAGVINIITKKSPDGKLDLNARVHEESVGEEYGLDRGIHNESIGAGYAKNKFNARFNLTRNFFGGYKGTATGREEQWHPKTQWLGDAMFGYTNDKSKVYYRIDYLNEDLYDPGEYGVGFSPGLALDRNYLTRRFNHQIQGGHTFSDKLSFNGALSFTNYSRRTRSTTVSESTGDVRLAPGVGLQDETTFNGATLRGTFQYKFSNKFTLQPGFDLNKEVGKGERLQAGNHDIGDYAFFLSGEWTIGRRVQLRPGLRTTYNTRYSAPPMMPSMNAKITINDRQDLRVSYGRGFRAPSLRELYFDFVDASHNIKGNPDLKAETSNSFNGSWNWNVLERNGGKLTTVVGGFYNDINQMIGYAYLGGTSTSFLNFERYKTKGVTWNNTWRDKKWDLSAGVSYTGRYNQYKQNGDELPEFLYTPEVTTAASYKTGKSGWTFSVYYKYTGKLPQPELTASESGPTVVHIATIQSYQWADVSVQKQLGKSFSVSGGIRNLFNIKNIVSTSQASGAHTGGTVRPVGSGRAYFLDLTYMFNQ